LALSSKKDIAPSQLDDTDLFDFIHLEQQVGLAVESGEEIEQAGLEVLLQ
jgi:hypothetical protein